MTGTGVEFGTGLRYTNPVGNLVVSGKVRTLLTHEYDEWGVDLNVRLLSSSGRGLSLSVNPVWGEMQSAAEQLWDKVCRAPNRASAPGSLNRRLEKL